VENLLIPLMTPGPNEPTADELQYEVELIVGQLVDFYKHGVVIKTPKFPKGMFKIKLY
jgi:hypothetical protein